MRCTTGCQLGQESLKIIRGNDYLSCPVIRRRIDHTFCIRKTDGGCITPCFSRHIGVGDGNLADGWLGSISISHADARRIISAIGHYHSVRDCDISASSAAGRAYTCASKSGISTTSGGMNRNIADSDIAADCTAKGRTNACAPVACRSRQHVRRASSLDGESCSAGYGYARVISGGHTVLTPHMDSTLFSPRTWIVGLPPVMSMALPPDTLICASSR